MVEENRIRTQQAANSGTPEQGRIQRQEEEGEDRIERFVTLGRAISDPIRVRMLAMLAEASRSGRGCCGLPSLETLTGAPAEESAGSGERSICVCEFQDVFSLGQSKVSYHMKKLKEAGLVREEKHGRWRYYSLNPEAAGELVSEAASWLDVSGVSDAGSLHA